MSTKNTKDTKEISMLRYTVIHPLGDDLQLDNSLNIFRAFRGRNYFSKLMSAFKFGHKINQGLHTGFRHRVINTGPHAAHRTMAF